MAEQNELDLGAVPDTPKRVQTDAFEKFWAIYPRKVAKGTAHKAWEKYTIGMSKEEEESFSLKLRNAVKAQIKWRHDNANNQEIHIPDWKHPSTWLNGMCWLDELASIGSKSTKLELLRCEVEGCEEDAHGPSFTKCTYHYSMSAPGRGNTTTGEDLRGFYSRSPVRRKKDETIREWIGRQADYIREKSKRVGQ